MGVTRNDQLGVVMVAALWFTLIVSSVLVATALFSIQSQRSVAHFGQGTRGLYVAESGANRHLSLFRSSLDAYGNLPPGTPVDPLSAIPACSAGNEGSGIFECAPRLNLDGREAETYIVREGAIDQLASVPAGNTFAGLTSIENWYSVRSRSKVPASGTIDGNISLRFVHRAIPIFQFIFFYNSGFELHPGPAMVLNGPIHANGDIYLASNNTLSLNGKITATGQFYRGTLHNQSSPGTVSVRDRFGVFAVIGTASNPASTYVPTPSFDDIIVPGSPPINLPPVDAFDPVAGSLHWDRSDLRVVLRLDSNGYPITSPESSTGVYVVNQDGTNDLTRTTRLHTCSGEVSSYFLKEDYSGGWGQRGYTLEQPPGGVAGNYQHDGGTQQSKVDPKINAWTGFDYSGALPKPYQNRAVGALNTLIDRRQIIPDTVAATLPNACNKGLPDYTPPRTTTFEIDMGAFLTCLGEGAALGQPIIDGGKPLDEDSEGGLIVFATVNGPRSLYTSSAGSLYAIRIRNAARLHSVNGAHPKVKGLTVISDQMAYLVGDYNAPADSNDRIPAGVFADSIGVLSSNWCPAAQFSTPWLWKPDCNSSADCTNNVQCDYRSVLTNNQKRVNRLTGGSPILHSINAAMLSGVYPSTATRINTGGHNYLQFHEDWQFDGSLNNANQSTVKFRGSLTTFGAPRRTRHSVFDGGGCNGFQAFSDKFYMPPKRDWDFDLNLRTLAGQPPGTPRFNVVTQIEYAQRFEREQ